MWCSTSGRGSPAEGAKGIEAIHEMLMFEETEAPGTVPHRLAIF
jgi:hypothetical protein